MTEFFYETAYLYFNCGLAIIKHYQDDDSGKIISTKYGFVNKNGVVIIPLIYDFATIFINGYSIVSKENKDGLIDTNGKEIIPFAYDSISYLYADYYKIKNNMKYGIIDNSAKIIIDMGFDMLEFAKENLFFVRSNSISSLISLSGEKKDIQINIISVYTIMRNKFLIGRDENDKYGAIDLDGNIIVPFCYISIYTNTSNNYFEFYNDDDKILIVNFEGRVIGEKNISNNKYNDRFENNESDYDDYDSIEKTYDEYNGSYAQDVMGYDDETINDVFDGDPDAYWNID